MLNNEAELANEFLTEQAAKKAAEQAAEEAKREVERAAWRASDKAARLKSNREFRSPILQKVAAAVIALGHKADVVVDDGALSVDGVDIMWYLEIAYEQRQLSRFRSERTNRVRVTVGDYGNKTGFPQRKDGTHNYESIAHILIGYATRQIEKDRAEVARGYNKGGVEALRKELKLPEYYGVMQISASQSLDKPVYVKLELKRGMQYHEVIALHKALKELGLVKEAE